MEKINSKEHFHHLVTQYTNLVFSICLKLTGDYFAAEDLTQETFISAYQHFDSFDGENEKAWLCRIAGNKCIDYSRASARKIVPISDERLTENEEKVFADPLEQVLNKEILERLKCHCTALPPPYNRISLEHFINGHTAGDIAKDSGTSVNTVKTQIRRARELLKKSYRKEMPKK